MNLTNSQITEWLRSPVTEQLKRIIDSRHQWLMEQRGSVFYPGEPMRTQETIVKMNGRVAENRDYRMSLDSVEDFIQEAEEDGKHQRDTSGGLQDIDTSG